MGHTNHKQVGVAARQQLAAIANVLLHAAQQRQTETGCMRKSTH
jgi:hypothetical protein